MVTALVERLRLIVRITVTDKHYVCGSLQLYQLGARQVGWDLRVPQSVFEIAPRYSCVLAREDFRPHTFAIEDGVHDAAMLIR